MVNIRDPIIHFPSASSSWKQGLSQEIIKGSPNLLIEGPGRGLGSSHNAI